MIRSGPAVPSERNLLVRIGSAIRTAFRDTALRLAFSAGAWRARMVNLWRWVAAELTDDPRHPRIGKRKKKAKGKSAAHLWRSDRP